MSKVDRPEAAEATAAGRRRWRVRRWTRRSSWLLGIVTGVLIAGAALPVVLLDLATRRARRCLSRLGSAQTGGLPNCEAHAGWLTIPSWAPWTRRWAELLDEELKTRMAVARYVEAAVGRPNADLLAKRFEEVRTAAAMVQEGSGRLRLTQLDSAMATPDPGALAFEVGDHRSLRDRGFDWTQWYTSRQALEASLLRGDLPRAQRLADHYAGRPDSELRLAVGALLCVGTEARRGIDHIRSVELSRAEKRNANMARDFGSARVLLEACAARDGRKPPDAPGYGGAGEWNHRERLTVMRLRLLELEPGCDGGADRSTCAQPERVTRAANDVLQWLDSGIPLQYRLELVAAVARYLPSPELAAELLQPLPDEPSALARVPLTLQQIIERDQSDRPFLTVAQLERAAEHLLGFEAPPPEIRAAAGAMLAQAAAAGAARGDPRSALAHAVRAGALALDDELARALLESSTAYVAGQPRAAMERLRDAMTEPRTPDALLATAQIQLSQLLAGVAQREEALKLARRGLATATAVEVPHLEERAAWLVLALDNLDQAAGSTPRAAPAAPQAMPPLGPPSSWIPAAARQQTLQQSLAVWRAWLQTKGPLQRASRYAAFRARGDSPPARTAHLVVAGLLADGPAQVEPWLDAFYAIDATKLSLRAYAWARAEAARWRGDSTASAAWLERYRALEQWSQRPRTAELFQELRL